MIEAWWPALRALLLLAAANTAPLLAKRWLGERWRWPLDAGRLFVDGRPWLGPSKTWRGMVAAIVATTMAARILGLDAGTGAVVGFGAMAGDSLSSFLKRRMGVESGGKATGLDQIPEALLPLLLAQPALGLGGTQVLVVTALFFALEMPLARLFHRFGLRDQPY
jgi:CDP-2,3-bis-(O-geranylgeranyl)-sn-glycerol synthase